LLVLAGVDALRSSLGDPSAPGATAPATGEGETERRARRSTTRGRVAGALPPCARKRIAVSLAARGQRAVIGVRSLAGSRCRLPGLRPALTIRDRGGDTIFRVGSPSRLLLGPVVPGSPQLFGFEIPTEVPRCGQGGPFVVFATVGVDSASEELRGSPIGCSSAREPLTKPRVSRPG